MRILISTLLIVWLFLLVPKAYAEETGFRFPSSCETNGSSCEHMKTQDSLYNYWDAPYAAYVVSTFTNFGIPSEAIIDEIQIKLRIRSTADGAWAPFVVTNQREYHALGTCTENLPSDYIPQANFNSIIAPTFCWHPSPADGANFFSGKDLTDSGFRLWLLHVGPTPSTEIDTVLFTIKYHFSNGTSTPEPFLDLPWDYESQGKSFENIIYNPNSWFDHKYPLQNILCCERNIIQYTGDQKSLYYQSHSGYDYGIQHGAYLHTAVLAAADGTAIFIPENKSGGGGNMIKIDHGNGYQTWYEHLQLDGLAVKNEGVKIAVKRGQQIGKAGFSGNVFPKDSRGAHIHFSVFKDINNNGSFTDDYPYGLVDPLGWEGNYPDPWTAYGNGEQHGAASVNLFLKRVKPKEQVISQISGGELTVGDRVSVDIQPETLPLDFTIKFADEPFIANGARTSIVPSFSLNAITSLGEKISQFYKPIRIVYSYTAQDVINVRESTLLLYYLNELTHTWEPMPSIVDTINHTLTAETTHFSHFAIMGEVKDAIAPTTQVMIAGEKGKDDWYRSSVVVQLVGKDTVGGIGLEYTLYQIDNGEWLNYTSPLQIDMEGEHMLRYLSIDKAGNEEEIQTKKISIDKTPPEATIGYSLTKYDIEVIGKDQRSSTTMAIRKVSPQRYIYVIRDAAGNSLEIAADRLLLGKQATFTINSLIYNSAAPLSLERNIFFTLLSLAKGDRVTILDQYYSVKNDKRIFMNYTSRTDTTAIYARKNGQQYSKEIKKGIILLQLETENGKLKFIY